MGGEAISTTPVTIVPSFTRKMTAFSPEELKRAMLIAIPMSIMTGMCVQFLNVGHFGRSPAPDPEMISKLVSGEVEAGMIKMSQESYNTALGQTHKYPSVKKLPDQQKLRILITGGAGFVGSNLVDRLMTAGHYVIVLDNMFTGRKQNIAHWMGHPHFELLTHDVIEPVLLEVDQIYHLACPASPPHYQYNPIKTIKTSTEGTMNMLGLAKRVGARIL